MELCRLRDLREEAVKRARLLRNPSDREDTVIVVAKGKNAIFQFLHVGEEMVVQGRRTL